MSILIEMLEDCDSQVNEKGEPLRKGSRYAVHEDVLELIPTELYIEQAMILDGFGNAIVPRSDCTPEFYQEYLEMMGQHCMDGIRKAEARARL